jgi:thiol-disulfide isomerase/thioredoxin
MLVDETISLGPVSLPVWILGLLGGILVAFFLQRTVLRHQRPAWTVTNDALLNGVLAGFATWKLTPLLTRFDEIRDAPSRLLYYAGGTAGVVAGALIAVAVALVVIVRRLAKADTADRPRPAALALNATLVLLVGGLAYLSLATIPTDGTRLSELPAYDYLPGYAATFDPSLPTVVTVWATWCGPCTAQMPEFDRFFADHGEDANVVALNLTVSEESLAVIEDYLVESSHSFPVALDRDGRIAAIMDVGSTPTTVVFDSAGRERARRVGAVNADWLARRVLPLGR